MYCGHRKEANASILAADRHEPVIPNGTCQMRRRMPRVRQDRVVVIPRSVAYFA